MVSKPKYTARPASASSLLTEYSSTALAEGSEPDETGADEFKIRWESPVAR
jgi:hypothetical protein